MTTLPTPKPVSPTRPGTPAARPRMPQALGAAKPRGQGGAVTSSQQQTLIRVSPASFDPIAPTLRTKREKILLIGDAVTGKTYAYLMLAKIEYDKHIADPAYKMRRFFVLDTDDTLPAYLGEGEIFEYLYHENGGNVYPYPCFRWAELAGSIQGIIAQMRPQNGDWIVVDTADGMYIQSQQIISEQPSVNVDLANAAVSRGLEKQGFGSFDPGTWNLVGRVHDSAIAPMLNTPANLMLCVHASDFVLTREKRLTQVMFENIGIKAKGRPTLPEMVDTVVVIWSRQIIPMDQNRRKVGVPSRTMRYMFVAKDRGKPWGVQQEYGDNLMETLTAIRHDPALMPTNLTEADRAKMVLAGELPADEDEVEGEVAQLRPHVPDVEDLVDEVEFGASK